MNNLKVHPLPDIRASNVGGGLLTMGSDPVPPEYGADRRRLGDVRRQILLRSIQRDIENQIHIEYKR